MLISLGSDAQKKKKHTIPKTDIVILENKDHITGEIRSLKYGLLTFKTNNAGTPQIKWNHIDNLTSKHQFEFELVDGSLFYGSLLQSDSTRMLIIQTEKLKFDLSMDSLVKILPIKNKFWSRFHGSLSLGASYTKASTSGQISYNSQKIYTTKKLYTIYLGR